MLVDTERCQVRLLGAVVGRQAVLVVSTPQKRVLILPPVRGGSSEKSRGLDMPKSILISNVLPVEARRLIPPDIAVDYNDSEQPMPRADFLKRLQGKDGLICHIISAIDDEALNAALVLKVVSNVAVGYNNIDVATARKRGVVITNTPDVLTETTADFAFTLLMAAARRVVEADRYVRAGHWKIWKWNLLWGADIHGK